MANRRAFGASNKRQKSPAEGASPSAKQPTGGPAKAAMRRPQGPPVQQAPLGASAPNTPPGQNQPGPAVRALPHAPILTQSMNHPPGPDRGAPGGLGAPGGGSMEALLPLLMKLLGHGGPKGPGQGPQGM